MIWPVPLLGAGDTFYWVNNSSLNLKLPVGYASHWWGLSGAAVLAGIAARIAARKGRQVKILIPGYFCGQSLRYLRSQPVHMLFYTLTEDLAPDYEEIRREHIGETIDIFVHVHYFGRIECQQKSRDLADEFSAVLVEDCAHVISPFIDENWVGDYLLFAPHKLFPLPSIGLAFSRMQLDEKFLRPVHSHYTSWLLRQGVRRLKTTPPSTNWGRKWNGTTSEYEDVAPPKRARIATALYLMNYRSAEDARRFNSRHLFARLESVTGWSRFLWEDKKSTPYLLGMLCDTPARAAHRFGILNRSVRLVMQWPDLPLEIDISPKVREQCFDWVDRALFFFVHQKLDISRLIAEVDCAIQVDNF
jgi:hypothetical protein